MFSSCLQNQPVAATCFFFALIFPPLQNSSGLQSIYFLRLACLPAECHDDLPIPGARMPEGQRQNHQPHGCHGRRVPGASGRRCLLEVLHRPLFVFVFLCVFCLVCWEAPNCELLFFFGSCRRNELRNCKQYRWEAMSQCLHSMLRYASNTCRNQTMSRKTIVLFCSKLRNREVPLA